MTDITTTAAPNSPAVPSPAAPPPAPAAPPAQPARRAASITDAAFEALPSDQQANFARIKASADGGSIWVVRDELGKEPAADLPGATTTPEKVKIGDYELSDEDVATILQEKAARDLRATQVPATAEEYQGVLPDTLKLPEGIEFKVDTSEPAFNDLRAVAKKIGLTQAEFSDILAIHASRELANEAMVRTAAQAEIAKLGPNATMRVTAIETFIRGIVGDELGTPMRQMIFTEKHVRGWEKLMRKMGSQGSASFSQSGREPAELRGRASEAEYNAMSQAERYAYAKGFDQKQFRNSIKLGAN